MSVESNSTTLLHHVGLIDNIEGSKQVFGVIFDMDGTLIHEGIDYVAMRAALGMPYPLDVIAEIRATPDLAKQQEYVICVVRVCFLIFGLLMRA